MATGVTNTAAENALFAKIYERAFLIARANSVMLPLVSVYRDSMGVEDRVFTQREQATAQSVAEGTDYQSPDRLGKTQVASLTPGEVMAQAKITRRELRNDPTAREDAAQELGAAMATKIDSDLLSVFTSLTGGEGSQLGSAGSAMSWGIVLAAQVQLHANNITGPMACVLHPYAAHDLSTAVNLVTDYAATPDSVKEGLARKHWVGNYGGITFYRSSNITVDGSDDAVGALFTPEAIAIDFREGPVPLDPEWDQSARECELNIYADYGYGVRRPTYGIDLISDATAPTS